MLWIVPIAAALLLLAIGAAIFLRELPAIQELIRTHPGTMRATTPQGFPWWLRWQHFINLLFLIPIIRSGLQIWAGHPRMYWRAPSTPGRDWLRIQKPMPAERPWSARDDAVALPRWVGLPGRRHSTGLARAWHLGVDVLWLANGVVFYVLLFSTGQWRRIVPTSLEVFPNALSTLIQYLSLDFPANNSWAAYNGLQMLAYFVTVFIAAPLAVITGIMQAPGIVRRLRATKSALLNPEAVRSIHMIVLGWFLMFTLVHVTLVFMTGVVGNLNHITIGRDDGSWVGLILFGVGISVLGILWIAATPLTMLKPAIVQRISQGILGPFKRLF
jgi:sulfoxide reductase catalytic subunit YedY